MRVGERLAEVGDLADLPQEPHALDALGGGADLVAARTGGQAAVVHGVADLDQAVGSRRPVEARQQRLDAREVELAVAPAQRLQRREGVALDRLDLALLERLAAVGGAEGAVGHVAPGAAGDLRHLGRAQAALLAAVELRQAGEGDVGHVHVEAHADRVGGDQVLDLAGLVHRDLGVAGARRERAQHHRGPRPSGGGSPRPARRPRPRRRRPRRCAAAAGAACCRRRTRGSEKRGRPTISASGTSRFRIGRMCPSRGTSSPRCRARAAAGR